MWKLVIFAFTTMVHAQQQNSRRPETYDNGHGWDIRLAVPGQPGDDYPVLNSIPRTPFSCSGKSPGYYSDVDTGCQVFRVCTLGSTYGFQSFLCPNGTLFNQEVLVCDWWMNVNCERSQNLFTDTREKFGNLKLGPQLMKDIKKMLTHPMRYPYDKGVTKSNLIVMQDYKPPSGQLFPNGALIAGPERSPNIVYVPSKQRLGNFAQNSFFSGDLSFAASTPSSQYIPLSSNAIIPKNTEKLQQQRQNLQLTQNGQPGTIYNSNAGQLTPTKSTAFLNYNNNNNNNKILQPSYTQNQNQNQRNIQRTIQQSQTNSQTILNSQSQHQLYNNQIKKQEFGISNTNIPKQNGQFIEKTNIPQFSREINGYVGRAAKQNLVSSHIIPPTGKTLKFSRFVQKSSAGNPKSRITFKTWIVRPSKTARLIVEPTPYTYNKPTNALIVNNGVDTNNPTTENPNSEEVPYVYNRPTPLSQQIVTTVEDTSFVYLTPTESTLANQVFSTSKVPQTSKPSRLYLAPTTYKPASRFYVPPSQNTLELSRQYLSPNLPSPETYQSARLVATPTSPAFEFTKISSNQHKPTFAVTKQSHINTNRNNLTFADILTKEKLDITVTGIVKDTNKILKTASSGDLSQYRQNNEVRRNQENNNFSSKLENNGDEKFIGQPPTTIVRSEKIIATPSSELEPPKDTSYNNYQSSNKLTNLPYFKEPAVPTNTIERTVSLKITIPETIAEYLFNNHSDSDSDNLEILNTGSTNYLVITNNHVDEDNNGAGFIPIGRLVWNKNLNVSNSQALVYSFLADSINAAKEYNNILKQNVVSTPTQPQIPNLSNEDIGDITNKISQLTSSQFANGKQKSANLVLPSRSSTNNEYYKSKYATDFSQQQSAQNLQQNILLSQQSTPDQLYSSRLQRPNSNKGVENLHRNPNQIYSGQFYKLPVPEVTRQIYNFPNRVQATNAKLTNELDTGYAARDVSNDISGNIKKQSGANVEIVRSESLPYPPTTQQLPRTDESTFNTQYVSEKIYAENFLNANTGITAQVQDKIIGTLPHPLEENKLVTYEKNKSYYLFTKLEDINDEDTNAINQLSKHGDQQNAKLIRANDITNPVTFELFPSIGYELQDEQEKQRILNALKINEYNESKQNGRIQSYDKTNNNLVTGVDFTILHPTSKKQVSQYNNANSILYRGPSSYLAPQSSVGSLGANQQIKSNTNSKIEQFENNNNNGYSNAVPTRQFSF